MSAAAAAAEAAAEAAVLANPNETHLYAFI